MFQAGRFPEVEIRPFDTDTFRQSYGTVIQLAAVTAAERKASETYAAADLGVGGLDYGALTAAQESLEQTVQPVIWAAAGLCLDCAAYTPDTKATRPVGEYRGETVAEFAKVIPIQAGCRGFVDQEIKFSSASLPEARLFIVRQDTSWEAAAAAAAAGQNNVVTHCGVNPVEYFRQRTAR